MKIMRRRSCNKPKPGSSVTSSSSGDDAEQEKTQHIINRLSKKYLAKEKSKTTPGRKKKKKVLPAGYDGDVETSPSSQSDTSISQDLYNFDISNDDDIKLELRVITDEPKPQAGTKRKAPPATKPTSAKRTAKLSVSAKQAPTTRKRSSTTEIKTPAKKAKTSTPVTNMQVKKADKPSAKDVKKPSGKSSKAGESKNTQAKSGPSRPFWKSFSLKDREESKRRQSSQPKLVKVTTSKKVIQSPAVGKEKKDVQRTVLKDKSQVGSTGLKSPEVSFVDSGVFVSPDLCSTRLRSPRRSVDSMASLGTPSIVLAKVPSPSQSESDLGFGSFVAPPSLSPVKPPSSASRSRIGEPIPMDTGSPIKSPTVERTYSAITMIGLPHEERKQKKRRGGRYSIEKYENWAAEMNEQFDDIENFELSIEG